MRSWAFAIAALCGCYAPLPPAGAPCDFNSPCPSGQNCVEGVCRYGGGGSSADALVKLDAPLPPDSSSNADVDGDGIANTTDNCPMYSNPGQGNEDGDPLGDSCDPCPIDPANPPVDPDGDGVSDICDPRPTTAGDKILVFEGFHAGVPSGWQIIGTVTQSGDDIALQPITNDRGALVPPVAAPANGVLTMKARITATIGNFDSAIAVVIPYDPSTDNGVFCEMYAPDAGSNNGKELDIWDSINQQERAQQGYSWQVNTVYTMVQRRTGNQYNCSTTPMGGTAVTINGQTGATPGNPKVGAFVFGINTSISWMMLVSY